MNGYLQHTVKTYHWPESPVKSEDEFIEIPLQMRWTSYDKWESTGKESILVRTNRRYKKILAARPEMMISRELDRDITTYTEGVKGRQGTTS